ncbi:MAG TPA: hypothetical protein VFW23_16480 [Tepidisphaeraceae bacterium]|nr:hypothetical protein [Tepidisphaeraceae bacterium]
MPALTKEQATEKLAQDVEQARLAALSEIYAELFPEQPAVRIPSASELAQRIRAGLEWEEIVDLWNVVFPKDRNVWYDEEDDRIHYDEELVGYADAG